MKRKKALALGPGACHNSRMSSATQALPGASFPYQVVTENVLGLEVLRLKDLDETIDQYFAEYEATRNYALFENLCPYFGVPWPAGVALARYLAEVPPAAGSALELGCGLALPSLVLARQGVRATASDCHPDVPVFLAQNAARNGATVEYRELDWSQTTAHADLIIGSDVAYDRSQPATLTAFLSQAQWKEAIFTDPGRPYWDAFLASVKQRWAVEEFFREGVFFVRIKNVPA